MKGITCACLVTLLVSSISSAQADEAPSEWESAILEIDGARCVGGLCLGMTLGEVERVIGPAARGGVEAWGPECESRASSDRIATFVDHDRNAYEIAFLLFPGSDTRPADYRVSSVSVTIDHGRIVKEILFDGLVRQWALAEQPPSEANTTIWSRTDRWSATLVQRTEIEGSDAAVLTARLEFPQHAKWLEAGYTCVRR